MKLNHFKLRDLHKSTIILRDIWFTDVKSKEGAYIFAFLYLILCIKKSTHLITLKNKGELAGLIFLLNKDSTESILYKIKYIVISIIESLFLFLNLFGKKFRSDYAIHKIYAKNYSSMESLIDPKKDRCELYLLALSPSCQGQGLGAFMLKAASKIAYKLDGGINHRLYLFTDDSCNYKFYVKENFTLLYKSKMDFSVEDYSCEQNIYVFVKDL